MRTRRWLARTIIVLISAAVGFTGGHTQARPMPADLTKFGLVCFCSSRVATPHMVIGYDNNGSVLFHARNGVTREQLRAAGAPVTDSQVRMLKDWSLLTEKDELLTTAFPVLEPMAMAALRDQLRPVADRLIPTLQPHTAALMRELARRGQSQSAYALLFSYVLDGLVWNELEASGKLPTTDITVDKPFWAGTFWAVFPRQDESPGTNTRSSGRAALRMMWNPTVLKPINDFYGSKKTGAWLAALKDERTLPALFGDANVKPVLVREGPGDPLYEPGIAIARPIAHAMIAADLSRELPAADESQRLLIGTHEMIWMVLADLSRREGITQPRVLSAGAKNSSDLAPLVIAVLSQHGKPSTT